MSATPEQMLYARVIVILTVYREQIVQIMPAQEVLDLLDTCERNLADARP